MDPLLDLSPEELAILREREARGQMLEPEVSDAEIGNIGDYSLATDDRGRAQSRLARALSQQQVATGDLMQAVSGPRGVPTPYGQVMVRQSPAMNIVKALRAFRAGQDVKGAEGAEVSAGNRQVSAQGEYSRGTLQRPQAQRNAALIAEIKAEAARRKAQAAVAADAEADQGVMDDVEARLLAEGY